MAICPTKKLWGKRKKGQKQIPIAVLEKRLKCLNNVVKSGGKFLT
jgi:hypothetical protein